MELTIPHRYVEDRSQVAEVLTLAEVVKVQRSSDGFRTSTGTTRTCQRCRQIDSAIGGVDSWPVATWLLTAEVFGDRRVIQWSLCSLHFKWLRDQERNTRARGVVDSQSDSQSAAWDLLTPITQVVPTPE